MDTIIRYITEDLANPKAASDFANELDEKYQKLEDHPLLFELSRNERLARLGYRRFVVGNYVVLYQVDEADSIVNISRMFYGKQDYEKHI